jgi:hypothetical protein
MICSHQDVREDEDLRRDKEGQGSVQDLHHGLLHQASRDLELLAIRVHGNQRVPIHQDLREGMGIHQEGSLGVCYQDSLPRDHEDCQLLAVHDCLHRVYYQVYHQDWMEDLDGIRSRMVTLSF